MSDRVLLDAADAYPEVAKVRAALAVRDWPAVRELVDAAGAAGRSMLLRYGADGDDLEEFLRAVVAGDPEDTAAVAMLGMHLIGVGWAVRTGYRAEHVSRAQFAAFHGWLRKAEVVLLDGVARRPGDPALWVARLTSARGLELGQAESGRRYGKLAALDPHHLPGQVQFLQQLCPKWGGTWERLHEWTREAMLAAEPGSLQAYLVVDGHWERWLDLGDGGTAYLRSVRGQIEEAAERSVLHPDFRRDYGWVSVVSGFAMAFCLLRDRERAAAMFRMLGDLGTELPWAYLHHDVAATIRARRAWALRDEGKR
ncbi:hypothetical protein ACQP2F_37040 [Actinoplanes sp. CA-030573]|uniref:hypothetical protein n=1 Tax=Actinoplanes sp. CA-030573 TaxID=3239898 RepID=UPI003D8F1B0D